MLSGVVPMMGAPAAASARDSFERRLAAELHDHPSGFSLSMISMTSSKVSGSKYSRSDVS
jgi:signal transduction histidine kinase